MCVSSKIHACVSSELRKFVSSELHICVCRSQFRRHDDNYNQQVKDVCVSLLSYMHVSLLSYVNVSLLSYIYVSVAHNLGAMMITTINR